MNLKNILNKLEFRHISELNKLELDKILAIRNEKNIRKNMVTKHIITKEEHIKWIESIKNSKKNFFYAVFYADEIIGGIGLYDANNINKISNWALYTTSSIKINGLGAALEFKALKFLFEKFELKNLICLIFNHNSEVIKLHKKFGFSETLCDKNIMPMIKNITKKDITYLGLSNFLWVIKEKEMLEKYFI
tara:strand:- start:10286 stop:10858 length:573 start_codon:yes stop_codon:yes gene_type:complete